jgi:hypothetical protein
LPLSERVQRSLAEKSGGMTEADRLDALQQFNQLGIDLEDING